MRVLVGILPCPTTVQRQASDSPAAGSSVSFSQFGQVGGAGEIVPAFNKAPGLSPCLIRHSKPSIPQLRIQRRKLPRDRRRWLDLGFRAASIGFSQVAQEPSRTQPSTFANNHSLQKIALNVSLPWPQSTRTAPLVSQQSRRLDAAGWQTPNPDGLSVLRIIF